MSSANIKNAVSRFNLFQYLQTADIKFDVTRNGEEYVLDCFKCFRHKLSLCASGDKKGVWHCYRCEASGNLFSLMAEIEGITEKQAFIKIVGNKSYSEGDNQLPDLLEHREDKGIPEPDIFTLPMNFIPLISLPKEHAAIKYAKKRGLTKEDMEDFDLRYCGADQRIVFPVYYRGNVVGWQMRDITGRSDKDPKYPKAITAPSSRIGSGFKKSMVFYGWDRTKGSDFVTIVEGPMDAIKGKEVNAIALMGKKMSDIQFKRLLKARKLKKVYLALDSDAKEEQEALAAQLRPFYEVYLVEMPNDRDFGDATIEEIGLWMMQARRAVSFMEVTL